jgi:hypothetical protein
MMTGYWISQSIYIAAKLGIADLLRDGPKACEELASATQTDAPSLYRLLRALASVGVFSETDYGIFALTPPAALASAAGAHAVTTITLSTQSRFGIRSCGHLRQPIGPTADRQGFSC